MSGVDRVVVERWVVRKHQQYAGDLSCAHDETCVRRCTATDGAGCVPSDRKWNGAGVCTQVRTDLDRCSSHRHAGRAKHQFRVRFDGVFKPMSFVSDVDRLGGGCEIERARCRAERVLRLDPCSGQTSYAKRAGGQGRCVQLRRSRIRLSRRLTCAPCVHGEVCAGSEPPRSASVRTVRNTFDPNVVGRRASV